MKPSTGLTKGLQRNSTTILTVLSVAGVFCTTLLGIRATKNYIQEIKEKEQNGPIDKKTHYKIVAKHFVPVLASGIATSIGIIGLNKVHRKRYEVISTAYSMTRTAFDEYRTEARNLLGEKKESAIPAAIAEKKVSENPVSNNTIIFNGQGQTLCYMPMLKKYFYKDINSVRQAVNKLNYQLLFDMYVSLNEFLYLLDLPEIGHIGDELGWNIDNGLVELTYSYIPAEDETPCLCIDFLVEPRKDYTNLH